MRTSVVSLIGLLTLGFSPGMAEDRKPYPLMLGDKAPQLTVAKWIKGEAIGSFQKDRIYVVEFWATWCVPCVRNIPHLTELQKKYRDRLTILGVSVWEPRPEEVEPFVAKMGEKMNYTVALDKVPPAPAETKNASVWALDQGAMSVQWLKASGWHEEGIPVAVIVDGQGVIAWMGDPVEMDEPLASIVEGTWDLAAQAKLYTKKMELQVKVRALRKEMRTALRNKEWSKAVEKCDELLALDPQGSAHLAGSKFQTLLTGVKDSPRAYAFAKEVVASSNDASALGQIAWVIVNMGGEEGKQQWDLARRAAERANEIAKGTRPGVLSTLAKIAFLRGEVDKAVQWQSRAVEVAPESDKSEFTKALEEYKKAGGK